MPRNNKRILFFIFSKKKNEWVYWDEYSYEEGMKRWAKTQNSPIKWMRVIWETPCSNLIPQNF